jgi:sigma-B regulation protein RsbU (phosphoserine phosphatase)
MNPSTPEMPMNTTVPDLSQRYAILLEMAQRISRTFDLPEILHYLLDAVRQVVAYDAAGVFVLNRSLPLPGAEVDRVIAAMAAVGFETNLNREDPMLRSGRGIIGRVITTGRPIVAPDVRLNAHYVAGRGSTLSEVAVPISSNGKVIGALNLESDSPGAYTAADVMELNYFATVAAISIEKAVLHHQVLEKQHLDHHLALAHDVQVNLLPASAPHVPGYDLAGVNLPTMEIGGDYFDYLPLEDGRLGLVVADVSGKGMAAALIMATFRAALRAELRRAGTIEDVMEEVSRLLLDSIDQSRYVTAVYGVLDPASGELCYMNCGQTPPILIRSDGSCAWLDRGRPALGMPVHVHGESGLVVLEPGDMLVIYTDGVVELSDPSGEEYGCPRLEALLRNRASLSAAAIVNEVKRATIDFHALPAYEDDFTLMVVKRVGQGIAR